MSQKSGFALEEDSRNLKASFKKIEEHDEKDNLESLLNNSSQMLDLDDSSNNLIDSSSNSINEVPNSKLERL